MIGKDSVFFLDYLAGVNQYVVASKKSSLLHVGSNPFCVGMDFFFVVIKGRIKAKYKRDQM